MNEDIVIPNKTQSEEFFCLFAERPQKKQSTNYQQCTTNLAKKITKKGCLNNPKHDCSVANRRYLNNPIHHRSPNGLADPPIFPISPNGACPPSPRFAQEFLDETPNQLSTGSS
ncbi:hypothetical protein FCV25MIE_04155 [Fagus crenata]